VLPSSSSKTAAEGAGGFALGGTLVESNHGAGIWISPPNTPGLEIMIPGHFVRSVVTASEHLRARCLGWREPAPS
jgi:hypothetical protein